MMKIKNVLFDLDGTIVDSFLGVSNCFRFCLQSFGIGVPNDEYLKQCLGPPLDYSFRTFFQMNEEDTAAAVAKYRERYAVKGVYECSLIDGVADCIKTLYDSGFNLLLATSKPEPYAVKIMRNFSLDRYFSVLCGSDFEVKLKNKADVINEALRRGNIRNKENTCIVGDRKYDVEGAHACGIYGVGIEVGFAQKDEFAACGADAVVKDFSSLTDFLLKNKQL